MIYKERDLVKIHHSNFPADDSYVIIISVKIVRNDVHRYFCKTIKGYNVDWFESNSQYEFDSVLVKHITEKDLPEIVGELL